MDEDQNTSAPVEDADIDFDFEIGADDTSTPAQDSSDSPGDTDDSGDSSDSKVETWEMFQTRMEGLPALKADFEAWRDTQQKETYSEAYVAAQESFRAQYTDLQGEVTQAKEIYDRADKSLRTLHGLFRRYEANNIDTADLVEAMEEAGVSKALQGLSDNLIKTAATQAADKAKVPAAWNTMVGVADEVGRFLKDIPLGQKYQQELIRAAHGGGNGKQELHALLNEVFEAGVKKGSGLKDRGAAEADKAKAREKAGGPDTKSSSATSVNTKNLTASHLKRMTPDQINKLRSTAAGEAAFTRALSRNG